ncbi:MAG TPA: tRNA (adenosine(37)-N6)-threonylcarbamoyltransferase complex dimerization subunit type 1 TsaB [Thermoanaerobaculia bacterium]|nr:tRNA (adenosine(37)-N6)-threonylcarbamoyltransferase complex dimerization subunit type 1 TsaB [Thermoanaerobaculia bacterium]
MVVLGLDSASPTPAIALVRDAAGGAVEEDSQPLPHGAAELLARRLETLMARGSARLSALDRVAVVFGPGSFTGVRAGIAFSRGLARALGVPLVARSTFEAASAALPAPRDVAFVLDAGRGEVHAAWRTADGLAEEARPMARDAFRAEAARRGLAVRDLDSDPLPLASALARLARDAGREEPVLARYGRPSAAEEKRIREEEAR